LLVNVIGLGYIGLPTAVVLAENGAQVRGVDVVEQVVDSVNAGQVPFVEPDLAGHLAKALECGRLTAATKPAPAQAFVIAVPTPFLDDHSPDLSYVKAAAESIAEYLDDDSLVVLESTSPPGTTRRLAEWVAQRRPDLTGVAYAYCPERVLPGKVMVELVSNDRVIGGLTPDAAERAAELYGLFCTGQLLRTDATTAELCKLVENSFRDVNIAFANELSLVSDDLGVDVWELIELANHHPRVNILQPGPGVGGHCIAVDPWFIVSADPDNSPLIRTAREVNDGKPKWVVGKVLDAVAGVDAPTVAALGLSFKPNIDDIRESPARAIVKQLAERLPHGKILSVEPHLKALPPDLAALPNVAKCGFRDAVGQADAVVLLVDHQAFAGRAAEVPAGVPVIDTRGQWIR
jgi:UDP-N-acetyl-D-mannosaminuronic acid dehydrogenase